MPKVIPYTQKTLKAMRERGRYVWKVEHTNPFRIVAERNELRVLRNEVLRICHPDALREAGNRTKLYNIAVPIVPNYGTGAKNDCFGFMDLLVIDPVEGVIAVQSTGPTGHAEHKKTILRNDYALRWAHHAKIELWSWRKLLVKKGGKLRTWQPRMEVITLDMFVEFTKTDVCQERYQDGNNAMEPIS